MHLVGSCTNVCSSAWPREEAARGLSECVCRVYGGVRVCGRGLSPGRQSARSSPWGLRVGSCKSGAV